MSRSTPILNRRAVLIACLAVALLYCSPRAAAQSVPASLPLDTASILLRTSLTDSLIRLPHQFVAAGTDSLILESATALHRGHEYSINYRLGILRFDSLFLAAALRDSLGSPRTVRVRYEYFPFRFQETYAHRTLVIVPDSMGRESMRVARPGPSFDMSDIFGPNLQKSGSIVRGFTVGSNRDLTLNSGLRMQLSGKIASDIEVTAALTDENTPIQPEGTTQTLQEFDKVFVEIRSTDVAATLGDFNLDLGGTEFAGISRKLQGAMGTANFRTDPVNGGAVIAGALTRGKYNTLQFNGLEGVQGPYLLTGKYGEREIIVIAGTEHVYVNGEAQTRGETNDYTIDYSTGEVTFTTRRLITAASRITIDYQYTDRQYSRSLFAAQTSSNFLNNSAKLTLTFLREADDQDNPIDFSIDDSSRQVLAAAGADRNKAVRGGVTAVDSNGTYILVDTVLSTGSAVQFYRYAPGDPNAKYVVTFSDVGPGKGDYVRPQVGVFVWNGPGGGNYLPIRLLPLPQLQQVADAAVELAPAKDMKLIAEYAGSQLSANRFSSVPGTVENGFAYKLAGAYSPRNVRLGGVDVGGFDLLVRQRFVNSLFTPIDRTNDIEFNRKWGIDTLSQSNEEIREASLNYLPASFLTIGTGYGHINRGDDLRSTRNDASVALKGPGLPTLDYYLEDVRSREALLDNASSWLRQRGAVQYSIWNLTPGFRYEGEKREISSLSLSALQPGSLKYDDFGPSLAVNGLGKLSFSGQLTWRIDDAFAGGAIVRQAKSFTQTYAGKLAEWNNFSSTLDVTLRKKTFSAEFKQTGNNDIQTVLIRSQSRYTPLQRGVETDLFYQVATERSSKLQRVFVRVTKGSGNYTYLGDLNHNGIADDNEFVPTRFDGDYIAVSVPSDLLYPIIDLNSSVRVHIVPARFIQRPSGLVEDVLSVMSGETYARVEEKSTEPDLKQIYLLHFSKFRRDSTTITGTSTVSQDLYFFEGRPTFSARLRYSESKGLNNFSSSIERNYGRERSIRLRWQLVPEISNQLDYANKIDRLGSNEPSNRVRDILTNDLTYDLSYRPEQNLEWGFKMELARSTDRFQLPALDANLNTQSVRIVYAFQGFGQVRVDLSREEIILSSEEQTFPYELTGGRVAGKTWLWHATLDYRVTQFIQASAGYDGRSEGGRTPVHTARAEVRAFF